MGIEFDSFARTKEIFLKQIFPILHTEANHTLRKAFEHACS